MSFSSLVVLASLLLQATAQSLSITSVGAIGTGMYPRDCQGLYQLLSLWFADFRADTGPSSAPSDQRVNCQLTLGVNVPSGYQFAFDQTILNAAYNAGSGVKLFSSTSYYFQGQLSEAVGSCSVAGPGSSGLTTLVNKFSPILWSPCGKSSIVSINTDLRADNGDGKSTGYIAVRNSTDASFIWRKC
ncbi:hypothetical protein FA13DRAFT_1756761 [Coprinellus micaceus]|uniref:Secreted protein n=1 Tax=Coprinellus micaceus TaxID=71717 RepID=A0A4Y7SSJ3_COPMI|nr:hypothetical protein FA13DRAFT_1756761 [Coprinellus micaceus]